MTEVQTEKRHAACDECRTRKLKCTRETPTCNRCQREGIVCVYSPQKQMGRPRKRRREEGTTNEQSSDPSNNGTTSSTPSCVSHDHLRPLPQDLLNDLFGTEFAPEFVNYAAPDDLFTSQGHQEIFPSSVTAGSTFNSDFNMLPTTSPLPLPWDIHNQQQPLSLPSTSTPQTTTSFTPPAPCSCLSAMYLTLSSLQTMPAFTFPASLPTQRQAMNTAFSILHCNICMKEGDMFSMMQNTQSLMAVLTAIAERYHRILKGIDYEAEELARTGNKKSYRVGDHTPGLEHLHTGTLDCPMGFNVEMEGAEWKVLAKKVVRSEVLGNGSGSGTAQGNHGHGNHNGHGHGHGGGGNTVVSFVGLLDLFEERQHGCHTEGQHSEEAERVFGQGHVCSKQEAHCLQMVERVRRMVKTMPWE